MDNAAESPKRVATLLLALAALFGTTTVALGIAVHRFANRPIRLEDLKADQRLELIQQLQRITPPLYEPHLGVPPPGFYHFRPDTLYDRKHPAAGPAGVLGDVFMTNELGFRSAPIASRKPGSRRLVVVGDSWTFGPGVRFDEVFTQQLQRLLDATGTPWEVINLGMMGWNTANEITALRVFLPTLKPDLVVICPTSNDIDDSLEIWSGNLMPTGFRSGAIFRNSYEYERRWVEVFKQLQEVSDFLRERGIKTFIYFLAEWRRLVPYYARLAALTAKYAVVPTPYIEGRYRLPSEIDPGCHASAEGHRLIGSYLYNALLLAGVVPAGRPVGLDHAVEFPGDRYDPVQIEQEFAMWQRSGGTLELTPFAGEFMGLEAMMSVPARSGATEVQVELELADETGLYPLALRIDVSSAEGVSRDLVIERYSRRPLRVVVEKPHSLDRYDFVEVRLRADRVVCPPGHTFPISVKKPRIRIQ